jgi:hypothetical protein
VLVDLPLGRRPGLPAREDLGAAELPAEETARGIGPCDGATGAECEHPAVGHPREEHDRRLGDADGAVAGGEEAATALRGHDESPRAQLYRGRSR